MKHDVEPRQRVVEVSVGEEEEETKHSMEEGPGGGEEREGRRGGGMGRGGGRRVQKVGRSGRELREGVNE